MSSQKKINIREIRKKLFEKGSNMYQKDTKKKLRKIYFNYIKKIIDYPIEKEFNNSKQILKDLKNKHKGKRVFLIGTGPSLNQTKFNLIKDEKFIAVNTFFNGVEKYGITPDYWVVTDRDLLEEYGNIIFSLEKPLFISHQRCIEEYIKNKKRYVGKKPILVKEIDNIVEAEKINKNIENGIYAGNTVIIATIQIALHLGFEEIYLLGCDCDYSGIEHFDGGKHKFMKGKKAYSAKKDFDRLMRSYKICKKEIESEGRKIYNATVGGKLEVFERKSIEEII